MKLLLVSILVLIIDQLSKFYIKGVSIPFINFSHSGLPQSRSIPVIDHLFYITHVENPGIAFGIDLGPDFKTVISVITILATLGLLIYFFRIKEKNFTMRFSVALIFGGALGNLTDRMFYGLIYGYGGILSGHVVDFLDIRLFAFFLLNKTYGVYVFNLADVAITCGVIILIYMLMRKKKLTREEISEIESTAA